MAKKKFYVVWKGVTPGIYTSWKDCLLQTKGYEGAIYKSFDTQEEAERAYHSSPFMYIGQKQKDKQPSPERWPDTVIRESIAVDAACSGNPGAMEYRGVYLKNNQQIFHFGPMLGTNNIGEFLAIVHGLALLKQKNLSLPVYTDSKTAMAWIKNKKCKTLLPRDANTENLFQMIDRAEKWLRENKYNTQIIKWETKEWGEIPADFGRK